MERTHRVVVVAKEVCPPATFKRRGLDACPGRMTRRRTGQGTTSQRRRSWVTLHSFSGRGIPIVPTSHLLLHAEGAQKGFPRLHLTPITPVHDRGGVRHVRGSTGVVTHRPRLRFHVHHVRRVVTTRVVRRGQPFVMVAVAMVRVPLAVAVNGNQMAVRVVDGGQDVLHQAVHF